VGNDDGTTERGLAEDDSEGGGGGGCGARRDAGDGRVGKETRSIGKEGEKPGSQTHIFDWAATQRKL